MVAEMLKISTDVYRKEITAKMGNVRETFKRDMKYY
jgi:hypothetical protein